MSVVAALGLVCQAELEGPDLKGQLLALEGEEVGVLLREIWTRFARIRPDLTPRVRRLCGWLWQEPSATELKGAAAVLCAAVKAGQLDLTADREMAGSVDLLGVVLQELRGLKAMQDRGAFYTPAELARLMAAALLIEEHTSICGLFPIRSTCCWP